MALIQGRFGRMPIQLGIVNMIKFPLYCNAINYIFVRQYYILYDKIRILAIHEELTNMNQIIRSESEIRTRYQITIPEEIRTRANLNIGDKLIWQYDEIRSEIIVMPKPNSFSDKLWGLGKTMWEKEPVDDYVNRERENW